ncbi:MAG TPA: hypothetical protein DGG94_02875 [Micromonosporaceae bacterium]|nr:hypothetical protein [Micromonosporaceae bacterium]
MRAGRHSTPGCGFGSWLTHSGNSLNVMTEETTLRRYERAQLFFEAKDYIVAAELLESVIADVPNDLAPRELLARSYYHSAQLKRAETQLRWIVEHHPAEAYAHLMLGRTLQRQSRHEEAQSWLRIAAALGADTSTAG